MKITKIVLAATLLGASGLALADYSGSREDRMQRALEDYRSTHRSQTTQGERDMSTGTTAPRNGRTIQEGARNAGQAIKHGAQKAGHAVGTGLHKTGEALDRAGSKLKSKTSDSSTAK